MPDQSVELEFRDKGIDALIAKVDTLASKLAALPSSVSVGASGGTLSRPTPASPTSLTPVQMLRASSPSRTGASGSPQSAVAMLSQVRVTINALASASAGGASGVSSVVSAMAGLPPQAALAVAALAAVTYGVTALYRAAQSAITPSFQNGNDSYNRSNGVFRTLGVDNPYGRARSFSDALNSNPYARSFANRNGVNPNNGVFGGDLDDASKVVRLLRAVTDPKTSEMDARRFDRSTGGVFSDEIARLRAASPDVRKMALNDMAAQVSPERLRAAADAQLKWNHLMGEFADLAIGATEAIGKGLEWLDHATPEWLKRLVPHPGGSGKDDKARMSQDRLSDALDRNTKATEDQTSRGAVTDGTYGGGGRTRGALPSGWGQDTWQRGQFQNAANLGVL